jgi:hypothetical protein
MVKEILEYNSSQTAEEQKICSILMDEINSCICQVKNGPLLLLKSGPLIS